MIPYLKELAAVQVRRILGTAPAALLTEKAVSCISDALEKVISAVSESTMKKLMTDEIVPKNPLAAASFELTLKEERENAEKTINSRLTSGESAFPLPVTDILRVRLTAIGDAVIEMLGRLAANRDVICEALTGGKPFTRIGDITLSAGDTHNHGRSVMILVTDAGKLVYKPRDMRGEAFAAELAGRFFPGVVGIPRCIAFGDGFGVCGFIEKKRSVGEEAAKRFYRNMGGTAAFIKILGSTDMHIENISCADDKPYILDLETILSPVIGNADHARLHPELWTLKSRSPYLSGLLPNEHDERQYSVLMNTTDEGCAPEVNGKLVNVLGYFNEFRAGYHETYSRILERRDELSEFIREKSGDIPIRILIRNTQYYHDTMIKLYHHNALSSPEKKAHTNELLSKIMHNNIRPVFAGAVDSELRQMIRGDIPYVYTCANSGDLFSDGVIVAKNVFESTAAGHALANIATMSDTDEAFDLGLVERTVKQYPGRLPDDERDEPIPPVRTSAPLTREMALSEAKALFGRVSALALPSPEGKLFWGYMCESDLGFRFCEAGLVNGLAGIALFACAYAFISGDENEKRFADKVLNEFVTELERMYVYLAEKNFAPGYAPYPGESEGIGGILTALALIKRYTGREDIADLQEKTLFTVRQFDLSKCGAPDRMVGMSGLLSALCRFEEYRDPGLIRSAAESLLSMKTLAFGGRIVWKPFQDKARPISGAGHGLAGIAEALYAASTVLGDDKYAKAASEAIDFELGAYSEKFGSWADLRTYPPVGYMHGYCSGAPGIGIMIGRIRSNGYESDEIMKCADIAEKTTARLPLNDRDHLCCGNSAIAEYYMTVGKHDEAGMVLAAMKERRDICGDYRYMGYCYRNSVTASLFYGASGIGYEMLRYAEPEKILSVI